MCTHVCCPSGFEVLTGNVPFHRHHGCAVVSKVTKGDRPEIPVDTPATAHKSGLWAIVQKCWGAKPLERPALSVVRQRLVDAVEMWDTDLGRSTASDGFVNVPIDVLLSSGDSSDVGEWVVLFISRLCMLTFAIC